MNVPSHYCETCNVDLQAASPGYKDVAKLCFCCTLKHRIEQPGHIFAMLMPVQLLTQQLKRSEQMEYLNRTNIAVMQELGALRHLSNLQLILQELVIDKNHPSFTKN